jgi:hypothetical protein
MANFIIWRLTKGVRVTGQTVVYQHGSSRISGGSTGSHVTGSGHDRKWRQSHDRKWSRAHAQSVPALFSYYSSSTKCIIAHDRHDYRMWRHVTPKVFSVGSCTISALVEQFHRKSRHQTSPVVLPLEITWSEVPLGCSLGRPRPITLSFSSPFTGYLPLSRHKGQITQHNNYKFVVFRYRLCCVVLQVVYQVRVLTVGGTK